MAIPFKLPPLSKGMTAGEVVEWLKSPGDPVQAGEPLVVVMSDKANVELESPAGGVLLKVAAPVGEEAPVGGVLCWIGEVGETLENSVENAVAATGVAGRRRSLEGQIVARPAPGGGLRASPLARRLAAAHGIPLAGLAGSGPGGLIPESDIRQAMEGRKAAAGQDAEAEHVPLQGVRRIMAERMAQSKQTAAAVTTVVDADMGAVRALKERASITYTSAVVRAAALALQQHRIVNASLEGNDIVLHRRAHVAVAVDAPQGLKLVTVADADRKPLCRLDDELRQLSQLAREGGPGPEALEAATFTVTNSGVLGSLLFTPMINPPQSAILGMGKVQDMPVVRDGQIAIRPMMYLCLTYDHRLIAGAEAVRFLQSVKSYLEEPESMA